MCGCTFPFLGRIFMAIFLLSVSCPLCLKWIVVTLVSLLFSTLAKDLIFHFHPKFKTQKCTHHHPRSSILSRVVSCLFSTMMTLCAIESFLGAKCEKRRVRIFETSLKPWQNNPAIMTLEASSSISKFSGQNCIFSPQLRPWCDAFCVHFSPRSLIYSVHWKLWFEICLVIGWWLCKDSRGILDPFLPTN